MQLEQHAEVVGTTHMRQEPSVGHPHTSSVPLPLIGDTPAHPHTRTPGHAPRVDDDVGLGESRGVFPVLTLPSDNRTGGEKGEPSSRGRHHPPAWFAT